MTYQVIYFICPKNMPNQGDWEVYGVYERLSQALRHYKRMKQETRYMKSMRKYSEVTKFRIIQNGEVLTEDEAD